MDIFNDLINELKNVEEIEGIMLGGSRATGLNDETSDYDVYVYLETELEESKRRQVMDKYCKYMEYSNDFWELEDDGILNNDIPIEFIYRKIDDIDNLLDGIVLKHNAWNGYTTCFWDNILNSQILFDKSGKLEELVNKYSIDYPKELKENIIKKNFYLLKDRMPSFYYQVEKAVSRGDKISINHRLTELLAGYFDIIFAINETLHPGEKRLYEITKELSVLPANYGVNLDNLFNYMYVNNQQFLKTLDEIINNLHILLENEGYKLEINSYGNQK